MSKGAISKQKGKKKGQKKKVADPFLKKEWYVVKIPQHFIQAQQDELKMAAQEADQKQFVDPRIGFSPAKKGGARRQLAARTFEMNLQDMYNQPFNTAAKVNSYRPRDLHSWKKFRFVTEEVYGPQLLTQWTGMEVTRNYRCSLIRKWHTMIQCFVDAKTKDGYLLRVKALAFTRRQPEQIKKNCYAKNSQVRQIRNRMRDAIRNAISQDELAIVTKKLAESTIGKDIRKSCQLIFPLKVCLIEKVKVLKKPKKEVDKLMKMHDLTKAFDPLEADKEKEEDDGTGSGGDDSDDGGDDDSDDESST